MDKLSGVLCKLDLEKTFDRVEWSFLFYMLRRMGFGAKWRRWMQECVSSVAFSVLVNGLPKPEGLCRGLEGSSPRGPSIPFSVCDYQGSFEQNVVEGCRCQLDNRL